MSRLIRPRSARFLEELPKNGNKMLPSAIKAGYSESYARRNGKNILKTAIKEHAKSIIAQTDDKSVTSTQAKQLMSEIVGLSKQEIMNRLKWLALENDRDTATGYKILASLSREHGVTLGDDDTTTNNAPVLNLSFGGSAKPSVVDGNVVEKEGGNQISEVKE